MEKEPVSNYQPFDDNSKAESKENLRNSPEGLAEDQNSRGPPSEQVRRQPVPETTSPPHQQNRPTTFSDESLVNSENSSEDPLYASDRDTKVSIYNFNYYIFLRLFMLNP